MRRYFDATDLLCVDLKKYTIFKDLSEAEARDVEDRITLTRLKKGSVVYREGCNIGGIYIVISGILKIYKTGVEGKDQIIRFAKVGDPIGYRSVVAGETACTSAEALTESSVCYVPADIIQNLFKKNSKFAQTLLSIVCKELGDANKFILNLAQKTVRERLAQVLLTLLETFEMDEEKRLRIAMTREDLANMVGTATESVIRLLSEFKADKLIELQGRYIKLVDIPQLMKVAGIR